MAVFHLACRLIAEPTKTNPPARVAKWQQACALPTCREMIWKGDTISCTRDNENGHRKGTEPRSGRAPAAPVEAAPTTQRDPFPMTPNEAEWVPRASLECARRLLAQEQEHSRKLASEVSDLQNILHAVRQAVSK